jgi:hypothetical protein
MGYHVVIVEEPFRGFEMKVFPCVSNLFVLLRQSMDGFLTIVATLLFPAHPAL